MLFVCVGGWVGQKWGCEFHSASGKHLSKNDLIESKEFVDGNLELAFTEAALHSFTEGGQLTLIDYYRG